MEAACGGSHSEMRCNCRGGLQCCRGTAVWETSRRASLACLPPGSERPNADFLGAAGSTLWRCLLRPRRRTRCERRCAHAASPRFIEWECLRGRMPIADALSLPKLKLAQLSRGPPMGKAVGYPRFALHVAFDAPDGDQMCIAACTCT